MYCLFWRALIGRRLQQCNSGISLSTRYFSITPTPFKQSHVNNDDRSSSAVTTSSESRSHVSTEVRPLGERIKENTKTASYIGVIAIGVSITSIVFYAIFKELFSSTSSNNVYSKALKQCINVSKYKIHLIRFNVYFFFGKHSLQDSRVQDTLGQPIKAFGEETRRRRRQHVAHKTFERNGVTYMQMHFYIQGVRNKATVQLEKRLVCCICIRNIQNEIFHLLKKQNFFFQDTNEYRYLFVQLDHYPRTTIILEDNRSAIASSEQFVQSFDDIKF